MEIIKNSIGVVKELFCGVAAENSQLESSNRETSNTN